MNKLFGKLVCYLKGHAKERRLTKAEIVSRQLLDFPNVGPDAATAIRWEDGNKRTRICTRCGNERLTRANKSHRIGSKAP